MPTLAEIGNSNRNTTQPPDALPVISRGHRVPGFFLAPGFPRHGFGIAPAVGRLVADLVMQRPPIVDPAAFSFSRFDRSPSMSAKRAS